MGPRARCAGNRIPAVQSVAVPTELWQPVVSEYVYTWLQKRIHEMTAAPDSSTAELFGRATEVGFWTEVEQCNVSLSECYALWKQPSLYVQDLSEFLFSGCSRAELLMVFGISSACLS
jgi:hypothetical protein